MELGQNLFLRNRGNLGPGGLGGKRGKGFLNIGIIYVRKAGKQEEAVWESRIN